MEDNKVILERKEKLIAFLKQDKLLSVFLIISALALLSGLFVKLGIFPSLGFFTPSIWFLLFVFSALSAGLVYYEKRQFSFYPLLAWVTWVAVYIRTLNLPRLRDVTTGGWTLGPDLDPFLFLRWAKYIVVHGSIMPIDHMRFVPIGFDTTKELLLLPYMMAWFHKIAAMFGSGSVEQSAALFPAAMFGLTVIAFFFLVRKIFLKSFGNTNSSLIALIASFFLSVIPSLIPRTIAGIPEKESAAFLFLFLAFYFFLLAWDSKKHFSRILFAVLAGLSTVAMAWIWGGFIYIFATLGMATFIAFLFGQIDINKFYAYAIWLAIPSLWVVLIPTKYSLSGMISAPVQGVAYISLLVTAVHFLIYNTKLQSYFSSEKFSKHEGLPTEGLRAKLSKIPKPLISLIVALIIGILLTSIIFGPMFLVTRLMTIKNSLVSPTTDRLGVTVAENRQPFFGEWSENFDPVVVGIPITFWLFLIGSVFLFYHLVKVFNKKERLLLTSSFFAFLICLIFSRYSSSSVLNGTNLTSLFVYALGFIILIGTTGIYYYKLYKSGETSKFSEIEFSLLLFFSLLFLSIVSARGAVRLLMVLVPAESIILGYFAVSSLISARKIEEKTTKIIGIGLAILVIVSTLFAGYHFYMTAAGTGASYAPSIYTMQWQKAMAWVRDNTSQNAVFGHWWDYGYWLQSIGERATVLDGGNSIPYWDYLMGRHALTGANETAALDFLYSHDTTHFLIDSTDIGKYPAFSSIGSDENYDRYSWINAIGRDNTMTQETKNSTISVYPGGTSVDEDIIYNLNGTKIFLPAGRAGLAAVITERMHDGKLKQPEGVFVYSNTQYRIPLRYAFDGKLIDFSSGLEAGIFLMPNVETNAIEKDGAILYLSPRTVQSQLARLYLYNEDDKYFKLVHSEDDFAVAQLKQQNLTTSDFVIYQGIRGPIRIWEINYPSGMKVNPDYLKTEYPNINLTKTK
jgi:asparagine N-glycosylation enzyme membrane subunit Stt3